MGDDGLLALLRKKVESINTTWAPGGHSEFQEAAQERGYDNALEWFEALEAQINDADHGIDLAARSRMVDIHVVLQDLKHGRDCHPKADIRAARLMQPFVRELANGHEVTGIERSYGKLKLTSKHARRVLREHGLGTNSGMAVTVGRAMDAAVRGSEWGDEDRPLFHHASENGHVLSVEQDAWLAYLDEIAAALEADVTVPQQLADDPNTGEDAADVDAELDALTAAQPESANTVVSTNNEGVLGGGSDD